MSEQGSAHNNHGSSTQGGDREFDSIYQAIAETAQGRRFLEEFARRQAKAEAAPSPAGSASATPPTSDAAASLDLFLFDVADMAQAIARTKAEIASIKPAAASQDEIGDATGELHSIVGMTESATSRILAAAERVQEIAWLLREKAIADNLCDELDEQATEIYTACSFQDLTGQRTRKVIQVMRYVEYRVNAMIEIWRRTDARGRAASGLPSAAQKAADALGQADVDLMMQAAKAELGTEPLHEPLHVLLLDGIESAQEPAQAHLPQERRQPQQDATLEDIGRALDRLAARPDDRGEARQANAETRARPAFVERRPDLAVAASILANEASAVKRAVERAAQEPAAAQTAEAPAPMPGAGEEPPPAASTDGTAEHRMPRLGETTRSVLDSLASDLLPQPSRERPQAQAEHVEPEPAAKAQGNFAAPSALPPADLSHAVAPPETPAAESEPDSDTAEEFLFGAKSPAQSDVTPAAAAPAPADPLAPLRALSDEEKIALFS